MRISQVTDQNGREENQDRASVVPKILGAKKVIFLAVYDGMGGSEAGGIAAQITKEKMETWFEEEAKTFCANRLLLADVRAPIMHAVNSTNSCILDWKKEHGKSLGSTMAAAVIVLDKETDAGEYIVINIGDSRCYKFGARNTQITKDQTLAQREVDNGNLSAEDAKTDRRQHILVQCLGYTKDVEPDFYRGKIKRGDFFLLCSDGMYNTQDIKDLAGAAKESGRGTKEKLRIMIEQAKKNGEEDNITAVLAAV